MADADSLRPYSFPASEADADPPGTSTRPASSEPTPEEQRILRRTVWPRWLNPGGLAAGLGLLSAAVYVVLYTFDASYLRVFGVSPEEVGLTQASLVIRAGMAGALFGGVLFEGLLIAAGLVFSFFGPTATRTDGDAGRLAGTRRRVPGDDPAARRSDGREASLHRIRRQTWALSLAGAAAITVLSGVIGLFGSFTDGRSAAVLVVLGALMAATLYRGGTLSHALPIVATALATLGLVVIGANEYGADRARDYRAEWVDLTAGSTYLISFSGLEVRTLCVEWASSPPAGVPDTVIYLGQASGTHVLSDGRRTFRVQSGEIKALTGPQYDGGPTCPVAPLPAP